MEQYSTRKHMAETCKELGKSYNQEASFLISKQTDSLFSFNVLNNKNNLTLKSDVYALRNKSATTVRQLGSHNAILQTVPVYSSQKWVRQ